MAYPRLAGTIVALACALSPATLLAQPAPATGPSPADRAEARQHFQNGVNAYGHQDYAAALEEFQNAYRLAPHPSVLVNMANCYVGLQRPAEALVYFERYLNESPNLTAAQRTAVEHQMSDLHARVGDVRVNVTPTDAPGLAVTLDGQVISLARPARILPGHYVVQAIADGLETSRQEIDVVAGGVIEVSLRLTPPAPVVTPPVAPPVAPVVTPPATPVVATPEPPATPPVAEVPAPVEPLVDLTPTPPPPRHGLTPGYFYLAAGVTGVAAAAWITCGSLALAANSDFNDTVSLYRMGTGNLAALRAQGIDQSDRARQMALWSDIAMGVTLVGAAATVVLFLKTDFQPRVEVVAMPLRGGGVLGLGGRF